MTHPFIRIQEEHRPWAAHNFPTTTADQTLMGMMEELGELAEASHPSDKKDAVGDVLIYALHHANLIGVNLHMVSLAALVEAKRVKECHIDAGVLEVSAIKAGMAALGKLAHARLKRQQGIRLDEDHDANEITALAGVVGAMELMALRLRSDSGTILAEVWDGIVAKRDWKVDADKGGNHDHRGDFLDEMIEESGPGFKAKVEAASVGRALASAIADGLAPTSCRHCSADLTARGAVSYREGIEHSCEPCHDPDWEDIEAGETQEEEADRLTGCVP